MLPPKNRGRCDLCGEEGHNKWNCPDRYKNGIDQSQAIQDQRNKERAAKKQVNFLEEDYMMDSKEPSKENYFVDLNNSYEVI